MKRVLFCLIFSSLFTSLIAQQTVEKIFPIENSSSVLLKFDFPKIKVSSWDKKDIRIKATVNINEGKNNDKFQLFQKIENGQLIINDSIDFKHIDPEYYAEINGVKKKFESKEDFENFKKNHSNDRHSFYTSNNADVYIEIMLPAHPDMTVESKFGLVDVENYNGNLTVKTDFGKINAKIKETQVGNVTLTNQFGKIYSNFNLKPTSKEEKRFYTSVTASPGTGPSYKLISKFGNIYLRNAQ